MGRLFHSLISTVMMAVNMLSMSSLEKEDVEFDYLWINLTMFLIGLICKIPNIVVTCFFKTRLKIILKEYWEKNQEQSASVTESEIVDIQF